MCGRSRCTLSPEEIRRVFGDIPQSRWKNAEKYEKRNNCHPGNHTPVAYQASDKKPAIMTAKWGLIPSFHKQNDKIDSFKLMNARMETAGEKPIFKRLVNRRRCVIAFNGFFEWKKDSKGEKQPYYIYRKDGKPVLLAGLWDFYHNTKQSKKEFEEEEDAIGGNSGEEHIYSYTILTMPSSSDFSWMHHRFPVVLENEDQVEAWLDHSIKFEDIFSSENPKVKGMFTPKERKDFQYHPVSKKTVNNIKYESDDIIEPVKETTEDKGGAKITSFFSRSQKVPASPDKSLKQEETTSKNSTLKEVEAKTAESATTKRAADTSSSDPDRKTRKKT